MALRTIAREDEDCLRKVAKPVTVFDKKLGLLLDDMAQTMYEANGAGLAAPQVYVLRRVVVVDTGDEAGLVELVNPEIIATEGEEESYEGCLSSPGEYAMVVRPKIVTIKAQDRNGKEFTMTGEGLKARAFCHEINHLDGILFKDLMTRMCTPEDFD